MEFELSFIHLKRLETAVEVLKYKQERGTGSVVEELLKQELWDFLKKNPSTLGAKIAHRKNIQDILGHIGSKSNLEKDSRKHQIISEVLMKLLKN